MSRKYKFGDNHDLYFISFAVVYWIDVFTRNEYKDTLLESWRFCQQKKGLEIYGWIIMPSHVHMIISSTLNKLEDIVRDMKSYTSTIMKKQIKNHNEESRKEWMIWMMQRAGKKNNNNHDWQFWQQHNKPLLISNVEMFHRVLTYIHDNPVEAGFVLRAEDWLYSSARDYQGNKGLIDISYIL